MVTVRIYLSTTSRIKTNPEDWDESFTGGNLAKFTKIIEKESYKIAQGFSYGSAPKSQTFSCKISAIPYYITQFESYDYIRVDKVTNGIAKTVFIGSEPTFQRTVETADWWSETVTFTDNLSKIEDKTFNSDKDWTWKITSTDGYKICDPSDTSKSLLHVLFNTYLNTDNLFTLHCDYSDTLNVTYFCVQGEDKVVDVWQDFLEQQGLAYYLLCNDLYIIDILEDKSITATTVTNIEEKATIDDKPYVEKKVPTIKRPTTIIQTNKEVYNSTDITIPALGGWFPSADMGIDVTPSYDNLGDNQEVLRYYNMRWEFWANYKYNPELWIYNGTTKSKATNGSGNGSISGSTFKYAIHGDDSYVVSTQGNLRLYADVDILDYSQKTQPDVEYRSDDEEEADYIYDETHAKRYIQALIYSKEMSAKTYSFYSTKDLSLNEICVINGFTKDGEYVRITDKQDNLDDFEGYTYKGTVYKGTQVSVSSSYIGYSAKEPYVNYNFLFSASRTLIECDSEGNPLDSTAITIKISLLQYYGTPKLTANGVEFTLTQDSETVEGQEKMKNSFSASIPLSYMTGSSLTLQAILGKEVKEIVINKYQQGGEGSRGQKGDKGDDGEGIASISLAFGVSSNPDYPPSEWKATEAEVDWAEGTWLWIRSTTLFTDERDPLVQETRQYKPIPTYLWDFSLTFFSRTYDKRTPDHSVDLHIVPQVIGYSEELTITVNGTELAPVEGQYLITLSNSDTSDTIIRMYNADGQEVIKTVKAIDGTEYKKKFVASTTAPTDALAGDYYYDLTEKAPKQLNDAGEWEVSIDHDVLLGTLDDAFSVKENVTEEVIARYAYFKNLIAKYIDVEEIFANEIVVKNKLISENYGKGTGFKIDGQTGQAELVGATLKDCVTENLVAQKVDGIALTTENEDVAGSEVVGSDNLLDTNTRYYQLKDALDIIRPSFTANGKANQLVDFSGENSSLNYNGTKYYKALYVTNPSTEISLSGGACGFPSTITDRQDIALTTASVVVPIASTLRVTGSLAQRYYKTNSRQSYTYYTDYAYWDSTDGTVYVDNMNDGKTSESQPSNPSDGDTYTTYGDTVRAGGYEETARMEEIISTSTKPKSSWTYGTDSSGIRFRYRYENITEMSDGKYSVEWVKQEASYYYQSYTTYTYHEGTTANTGYKASSDNATGGYVTAVWQYSYNGSSWTSVSGSSFTIAVSNNQTVYIRQYLFKPTATYYVTNGYDTTTTTCPWGGAKNLCTFLSYYSLSNYSTGYVYLFDANNALKVSLTASASDNPISATLEMKYEGTTWFYSLSSETDWLAKLFYKVKATPFTTEIETSSFTALNIAYEVFAGSSGTTSATITTGTRVIFSNSSSCVVVDNVIYITKNNFYKSASATLTPNAKTKGVYVSSLMPKSEEASIGESANRFKAGYFKSVVADTFTGNLTGTASNATNAQRVYGPTTASAWIGGMTLSRALIGVSTQQTSGSYHPIIAVKTYSGNFVNLGGLGDTVGFYGYKAGRTANSYDWNATFNSSTGTLTVSGGVYGAVFN